MRALRQLVAAVGLYCLVSPIPAQEVPLPTFAEHKPYPTVRPRVEPLSRPTADSLVEIRQQLPESVTPGQPIPVEVIVRNVSSFELDKVTLVEELPTGFRLANAVPMPQQSGRQLFWALGSLSKGQEQRLRFTLETTSAQAGVLRNRIQVDCQIRQENTATVRIAGPELDVQIKGERTGTVNAPSKLQLVVANKGQAPARNVILRTVLSEGLAHPAGNDLETELGSIAPGETHEIPLEVVPKKAGELQARLSVQTRGASPVSKDITLSVKNFQIGVKAKGPVVLQRDLTGLFQVTVTNEGTTPVSNLRVAVVLPGQLPYQRAASGGAFDPNNHAVYWTVESLNPGEKRTLAWNSIAKTEGFAICKVWLVQGQSSFQKGQWVTEVVGEMSDGPNLFDKRATPSFPNE